MNGGFAAIETYYKNIRFRSRLEATWACFFDLLGWQWEYEPVDFAGWIPDFAIYGKDVIYVEVKPVIAFPQVIADEIDKSGCMNEALIVGQTPLQPAEYWIDELTLGWMREIFHDEDKISFSWGGAIFGQWKDASCIGFCHEIQSYRDRISGCYDGGRNGALQVSLDHIRQLWAQAKNTTQWKRPR